MIKDCGRKQAICSFTKYLLEKGLGYVMSDSFVVKRDIYCQILFDLFMEC